MIKIGFVMMAMLVSGECIGFSDRVISLSELNRETVEDFWQGKIGNIVLECPEGTCLPVKMAVKGEFLALESPVAPSLYLKVLKTCYIRCVEREHFVFSEDLQNWKEPSEFFTGRFSVSVGVQDGQPMAELELELNQR